MYRVHMLPAEHGDCLLIEYGQEAAPHRILIDGGTTTTWKRLRKRLEALPEEQRKFELLVVTHVDADHIGGALSLLDGSVAGLEFKDIWFNGYRHLSGLEEQGPVQAERFTTQLWPLMEKWNHAWNGKAVVVPDTGKLPAKKLTGGMKIVLLSPTQEKLQALRPEWEKACAAAGLDPQVEPPAHPEGLEPMGALDIDALAAAPFHEDSAEANGSSIAFVAQYDGKSVLFGADAHPSILATSIRRLPAGKLSVNAFKLPHHASKNNIDNELLELVETSRYLVSTNGSHFKHPDREALARVVCARQGCELRFNYRTQYNLAWDSATLQTERGFTAVYPENDDGGDVVDI